MSARPPLAGQLKYPIGSNRGELIVPKLDPGVINTCIGPGAEGTGIDSSF